MSNPAVQLDIDSVAVLREGKPPACASVNSDSPASEVLAFAQLVLLQALIERQSLMADALSRLVAALTDRMRPPDPKVAMEAAGKQVIGLLEKFGIPVPPGMKV